MELVQKANVRGISASNLPENIDAKMVLNPRGEQVIAIGLPGVAELIRLGNSFIGTGATPGAALAATIPTTAATNGLWNGELPGGKSYVLTAVYATTAVTNAAACNITLFGCLSMAPLYAVPGTEDTSNIRGMVAGRLYTGKGKIVKTITPTTAPVASTWFPIGKAIEDTVLAATVGITVGGTLWEPVILPPGFYFAIELCATAVTGTFTPTFFWHEIQIPTL